MLPDSPPSRANLEKFCFSNSRRGSYETEMSNLKKMLSRQTDKDLKNRDAYLNPSLKVAESTKKTRRSEVTCF